MVTRIELTAFLSVVSWVLIWVLLSAVLVLAGCVDEQGALIGLDGQLVKVSAQQILEEQERLSRIDSEQDMEGYKGNIAVFEGRALVIGDFDDDWLEVQFKVDKVIFGIEQNEPTVLVVTPLPARYGVEFRIGRRYRVLAAITDGNAGNWPWAGTGTRYVTWSWQGTYEIKN